MKSLPGVCLYIRITDEKGRRRYERIRRRSPQMCGPKDVYYLHFYENGKRKWLSVGIDLNAASRARRQKEQELLLSRETPAQSKPSAAPPSLLRSFEPRLCTTRDPLSRKMEPRSTRTQFALLNTGWDNFNEPLDLTHSSVKWSVSASRKLTVTFTLAKATPNKLYQVALQLFCSTSPAPFGNYPVVFLNNGNCVSVTKQGVTKTTVAVELGVVTTDLHGNGSFKVVVGPIASGTYELEFDAQDGAGCFLIGGNNICAPADFQSPVPKFGEATTITIP